MKRYAVYIHTNRINGKRYVGITSMKPKKRWNYGYGYELQPKFFNAITKHGWENFGHEIIATGLSKDEACGIEKSLIAEYDTIENGYNVSEGGIEMDKAMERIAVDKYNPDTGEYICSYASIMDAAFDVQTSDSHISEACRGKHSVIAGFGWTYHGEPYTPPKKYAHYRGSIEKIDPISGEVVDSYKSIKQAAEENGLSRSLICMCCNGKCKSGGGYEWRRKI